MSLNKFARPCIIVYAVEASDLSRQNQIGAFADRLNADGVDTEIDFYHVSPPEGWNVWMERMIKSRRALIICTERYQQRFDLDDDSGAGGVAYEARLIREKLKAGKGTNLDAVPIVLEGRERQFIPCIFRDVTPFDISSEEGYEALYAFLTGRELRPKPQVGAVRDLRSVEMREVKSTPIQLSDDAAVRSEIEVALERLLSSMRRVFIRGNFSLDEWQMLHNDLDSRVRNHGARPLGSIYSSFCRALDYDQFSINYQWKLHRQFESDTAGLDNNSRRMAAKKHAHDAYAMQNVATDVQRLAPFLRALGNDDLAGELEYVATSQREIAERELGRLSD